VKALALFLLLTSGLSAADTFEVFHYHWSVPKAADWKVVQQDGSQILRLVTGREPPPGPRRPMQFALADTREFRQVRVELGLRPLKRSLLIVFAYRDPEHFDYAHLSTDTAAKQPRHNGIFHVYGGERVRISSETGPAAFAISNRWYQVRLQFEGSSGRVQVTVDGQHIPALDAVDLSLSRGKVGIGSFDETGDFRDVKITGN